MPRQLAAREGNPETLGALAVNGYMQLRAGTALRRSTQCAAQQSAWEGLSHNRCDIGRSATARPADAVYCPAMLAAGTVESQ